MTATGPSPTRRRLAALGRRAAASAGLAVLVAYLTARLVRLGAPAKLGLAERLDAVPLEGAPVRAPVTIRWNAHHVPFLEADHDRDLAVGIGVVHAHLRLAQIELMRRIALGRLSEMIGPAAIEADHALRAIDFVRAGAAMEAVLTDPARDWLEGFADGLNFHIASAPALPHELRALDISPEPWSLRDLLAVSRLASMDFTWRVWMRLFRLRSRPDWTELWRRLMAEPFIGAASVGDEADDGPAEALTGALGRGGSNAFAVSPERTASGAALLAGDPHLSMSLPGQWLILGMRSPGYHAVGMMVPGVPAIGLGRNPWIAWGGTNLHGASSELVDAGEVTPAGIEERRETIAVRWGRARAVTIRETRFGPVISDAALLGLDRSRPVALHWIGHRPSDEMSPFLGILAARDWDGFRTALEGYAIPALNMVYADREGHIGQLMAARLPRRPPESPIDIVSGTEALRHWESFVTVRDLPAVHDPPEGFVASANNAPPPMDMSISLFFSPDDRVRRLRELLSGVRDLKRRDVGAIHADVVSPGAVRLRDRMLPLLAGAQRRAGRREAGACAAVAEALRPWDGAYCAESAGALAFELMVYHLVRRLHGRDGSRLYSATWDPWALLSRDLDAAGDGALTQAVAQAAQAAARGLDRHRTWGRVHRLRLAHPLAMLPLIGRRYVYANEAVGGSNETLMKTAHGFSGRRHRVRFGANARQIIDLADEDENYFVVIGGQDGWLGSDTLLDQFDLWRRADYVRVPMRPATVRAEFGRITTLRPAAPCGKA